MDQGQGTLDPCSRVWGSPYAVGRLGHVFVDADVGASLRGWGCVVLVCALCEGHRVSVGVGGVSLQVSVNGFLCMCVERGIDWLSLSACQCQPLCVSAGVWSSRFLCESVKV